jgi:hypothetical protein
MLQLNTFELEKLEEATGISEKKRFLGKKNTGPVDSTVMRKLMVKAHPPTPC